MGSNRGKFKYSDGSQIRYRIKGQADQICFLLGVHWATDSGVTVIRDPNHWLATLSKTSHSVRIALATDEILDAPTKLALKNPILSRNLIWWVDAKELSADLKIWAKTLESVAINFEHSWGYPCNGEG